MKPIMSDDNMYQYFQEEVKYVFRKICSWEQPYFYTRFTVETITDIAKSLSVLYDSNEVKEEICLIDNALEILNEFICIEGMENLLVNNYSAIENAIFLEHSSSGKPRMIREHYKHQFRNVYLGLVLMEQMGLWEDIEECISEEANEYSCYIMDCIRQDIENSYIVEKKEKEALKEIVYKTYFVAALFHDIGYPLSYYFRVSDEIQQFTPFFKIISSGIKTEFSEIKALLNNSLLFRTINTTEIKKKYENNDHGCLSAISFLLNFYFSGSIYSIGQGRKNRCIVEMAAVAIYKHTDKCEDGKGMLFSQDAISYLLRICDDMQEWQRFMVLIEDTHNYLMCPDCGKIIAPKGSDENAYRCDCESKRDYHKITKLKNKKLNYIDICDQLELSDEDGRITVKIEYDYYRQIELLLNNYKGVVYREKGLKELKALLENQNGIRQIKIEAFLSNNPILLIHKMIEESEKQEEIVQWLRNRADGNKKDTMQAFYREYEGIFRRYYEKKEEEKPPIEKPYGEQIEIDVLKYGEKARKYVKKYLGEIYELWCFLEEKPLDGKHD